MRLARSLLQSGTWLKHRPGWTNGPEVKQEMGWKRNWRLTGSDLRSLILRIYPMKKCSLCTKLKLELFFKGRGGKGRGGKGIKERRGKNNEGKSPN